MNLSRRTGRTAHLHRLLSGREREESDDHRRRRHLPPLGLPSQVFRCTKRERRLNAGPPRFFITNYAEIIGRSTTHAMLIVGRVRFICFEFPDQERRNNERNRGKS